MKRQAAQPAAPGFPDVLDDAGAQAYLSVNEHTLRRLREREGMPHSYLSDRTIRYSRRLLLEWLEARSHGAAQAS